MENLPLFTRVLSISGGAGFLPPTVGPFFYLKKYTPWNEQPPWKQDVSQKDIPHPNIDFQGGKLFVSERILGLLLGSSPCTEFKQFFKVILFKVVENGYRWWSPGYRWHLHLLWQAARISDVGSSFFHSSCHAGQRSKATPLIYGSNFDVKLTGQQGVLTRKLYGCFQK